MWDRWQTFGTNAFISHCLFQLQQLSQYCSQAPENHRRGGRRSGMRVWGMAVVEEEEGGRGGGGGGERCSAGL